MLSPLVGGAQGMRQQDTDTARGFFDIARRGEQLALHIPAARLDAPFLLIARIAGAPAGGGYGGLGVSSRIVSWQVQGTRLLLREQSYSLAADSSLPVARAVNAASLAPILAALPIKQHDADGAITVDVTSLFTSPPLELGPGGNVRGALDANRSFLESATTHPNNVEIESTLSYANPQQPQPNASPWVPQPLNSATSVRMHWSMVRLPETPMPLRLSDTRVGVFYVEQSDFGNPAGPVDARRYVMRWRLEKRDPAATVSDVVTPITFYIDPATPAQWIPWVRRGVEAWASAFEAAGFRGAIVAREAPRDTTFSVDDARYSVIRWVPSTIEDASGPTIADPRTGEILSAQVLVYQNVLKLNRDAFVAQLAAVRPEARQLPLPDTLLGRLLEATITHEVGHTLGLAHNFKASAAYLPDSVRSASFLKQFGFTPSIMDYVRFDYVVQPGDHVALDELVPRIGPYDVFAIRWAYTPIPGAALPAAERTALERIVHEQDGQPMLRYVTEGAWGADAAESRESVGDAAVIAATRLGIANLRRTVPLLPRIAAGEPTDVGILGDLYNRVLLQWRTELGHVVGIIGGASTRDIRSAQGMGVRFSPLPRDDGVRAMAFLAQEAFASPEFLLDSTVLRRIEAFGSLQRLHDAQNALLQQLLNDDRLARLAEYEATAPSSAAVYTTADLFKDLRVALWSELSAPGSVHVTPLRRDLQRSFLFLLDTKLNRPNTAPVLRPGQFGFRTFPAPAPQYSEAQSVMRASLRDILRQARSAMARAGDAPTRMHLEAVEELVARTLDGRR